MASNHHPLPSNLPVPKDDGACDHLPGKVLPSISLSSTSGQSVDLSKVSGLCIVFCYPRMAPPSEDVPKEWDDIPGARGCTPQACSFRDLAKQLSKHGVETLYGLSTQDVDFMKEAKERLHLPYDLLSDVKLDFANAMGIPTFDYQGETRIKRVTLAVKDGKVVKHWYPIFPSSENAPNVLKWLEEGAAGKEA